MTRLAEIRKQIAELQADAERIVTEDIAAAVAQVKQIMANFGLTPEHLGFAPQRGRGGAAGKTRSKRAGAGVAKYADPATGKTWTGFGRVPNWIAGVKDRSAFLVHHDAAESAAAVATEGDAATKKPARKASAKRAAAAPRKRAAAGAKKAATPRAARKSAARG